ncbi:hypothetical protein ACEPAG_8688 [Sanghuangporus baumii]
MPALSFSNWNLSSVTLASTKSKSQRNKLRRRRRPPPLRDMSGDANGAHENADEVIPPMPTPMTASSATARSISPTLHEKLTSEPRERDTDKDDAQAQVISSLRAQITDLITQVSQLNSKLVKSYDRVSDLEDELHIASQNVRTSSLKISNLEIERAQHLAALNTGLYVEKAHVTAELTRLMERATEEAAARGQAESARQNIEKDLDDLSASLFAQANTMVAEARLGRAMSERKVVEAEMALKGAEEAVGVMQQQMQALRDEKNRTDDEISRLRILMEKGKFVEHPPMVGTISVKLLSSHAPYQEFLQFVVHLRSMRHSTIIPPHISTLLPLPFLARLQAEDSDPTVRLDLAPSLNWLSRRSVVSAIHCGQLTIEPMSVTTLMSESMSGLQSMIGSQPGIACALCGTHIYPPKSNATTTTTPPSHPLSSLSLGRHTSSGAWSSSIFKNPLSSAAPSPPPTPPHEVSAPATPTNSNINMTTVYVFRLAQTPMQGPHPPSSYTPTQHTQSQRPTSYPLCASGWCLARLRATCSLWAFVRAGIVDRVWEEEPAPRAAPSISSASSYSLISNGSTPTLADTNGAQREPAPPLPPRRRSKITSMGALWEKASGALRSATPTQSQPASPITNGSKENEDPFTSSPRSVLGQARGSTPTPEPLKVTVPPPLPRRNHDRRVSEQGIADDKMSKEDEAKRGEEDKSSSIGSSSPTEAAKSINEGTPITGSRAASPTLRPSLTAQHITIANSQASSALGEEFSTPTEEIGSFPPSVSPPASATDTPIRPSTPHSPRSTRSSARNSMSPPRSPGFRSQRISSPPLPHSPRSIPLPDSRPGTPASPRGTHARRESASIAPLNIDPEKLSRPPSRAASPRPTAVLGAVSPPPPVPRRAAARRIVPPPPSTQQATPPSSGSNDEKEVPSYSSTSGEISSGKETETPSRTERRSIPPPPRRNEEDSATMKTRAEAAPKKEEKYVPLPPPRRSVDGPRLPPRRPGLIANNKSVTDFGDKDDERMDSTQDRPKNEKQNGIDRSENDDPKNYVGDTTWEERTWKEIVRLREDMFWARIGAIRG